MIGFDHSEERSLYKYPINTKELVKSRLNLVKKLEPYLKKKFEGKNIMSKLLTGSLSFNRALLSSDLDYIFVLRDYEKEFSEWGLIAPIIEISIETITISKLIKKIKIFEKRMVPNLQALSYHDKFSNSKRLESSKDVENAISDLEKLDFRLEAKYFLNKAKLSLKDSHNAFVGNNLNKAKLFLRKTLDFALLAFFAYKRRAPFRTIEPPNPERMIEYVKHYLPEIYPFYEKIFNLSDNFNKNTIIEDTLTGLRRISKKISFTLEKSFAWLPLHNKCMLEPILSKEKMKELFPSPKLTKSKKSKR